MGFPTIDLMRTGANIVRLRKAAGLTVHDLQMVFGFNSPQAIYKWQNGAALPTVDNLIVLAALLHAPGLLTDEGPSAHGVGLALGLGGVCADLGALHPVGPGAGLPGCLLQPPDLLFQLGVLGQLVGVPALLVLVPGGEIAPLELDAAGVDGEDVVHAAVQKRAVVGHQQKAPFAPEIAADQLPACPVQMVGGLVDQQEAVVPGKEHGQQNSGPLPAGERGKRAVQCLLRDLQRRKLPQKAPLGHLRADGRQQLQGALLRVRHRVGKVVEAHAGADGSPVGVHSLQKPEQGGFSPAVAAGGIQPPVGVDLEADVFKNVVAAALVAEGQVGYLNQGHGYASYSKNGCGKRFPQPNAHTVPAKGQGNTMHGAER